MKKIHIRYRIFTLLILFSTSLLFTSCQKEEVGETESIETKQHVSNTDDDSFMSDLIRSTSSLKIKEWLTSDFITKEESDPDAALKLFSSFTIDESKEANEIMTKLESYVFETYTAEEFDLSEEDMVIAREENAQAAEVRRELNKSAMNKFGKTMWSLNETEMLTLNTEKAKQLHVRGNCTSRTRRYTNGSKMTTPRPYNSNCKASYNVIVSGGSDCDWEFRFEGKKSKHRVVTGWWPRASVVALAAAIEVGLRAVHGTTLGTRYAYWGGRWHTYLLIGYPDQVGANAGTTIARWTLKRYLSMH